MTRNEKLKSALVMVLVFAVFALALTGMNIGLAPAIERSAAAGELAPLYAVMPEASGFEALYTAADPAASTLAGVSDKVQGVYAETSGAGYVLLLSTSEGYTKEPIGITLAVDGEGKISGVEISAYPETKDLGAGYMDGYLGQDSTLAAVSLVSGATYSSSAIRGAIEAGFAALIDNELVGAGVKGDAQLLEELMPVAFSGMANSAGIAQYEEQDISAAGYTYIQKSMKALTGTAMAYIVKDGESSYLALCNCAGGCKVVDVEGNDVTADVPAIVDEAKADAAKNIQPNMEGDLKTLARMVGDEENTALITALPMDNIFSSITGVYSITTGEGAQLYGFVSTAFGYSNMPFVTYYILDENGAITAMDADELILIAEYFTDYQLDEPSYKAGFAGLTADSFTGDQALISGATVSSDAVKTAVNDVFAAFGQIMENGGVEA